MNDRFRISALWPARLAQHGIALSSVLRRAGLPSGFFEQAKIYATTAELFAFWRAVGETSGDPVIGLKLGEEPRLERSNPTAIAAVCSRSFRDALAGLSFQQVVEETRRELARHYLGQSAVELNETAYLLGYEDANSFFRAFHAWEGTSPGAWRARQLQPAGATAR
jgi:hypothetical protein